MINFIVGHRFSNVQEVSDKLQELGAKTPNVFESESDLTEEGDFMLDGCLELGSDDDTEHFTLHYLRDRANNYYITEANYWA